MAKKHKVVIKIACQVFEKNIYFSSTTTLQQIDSKNSNFPSKFNAVSGKLVPRNWNPIKFVVSAVPKNPKSKFLSHRWPGRRLNNYFVRFCLKSELQIRIRAEWGYIVKFCVLTKCWLTVPDYINPTHPILL